MREPTSASPTGLRHLGRAERPRRARRRFPARAAHAARARVGRSVPADDGEHRHRLDLAADRPRALGLLRLALATFRQRGDAIEDGPPIIGNARIQIAWVDRCTVIVLFLAAYGTYSLTDSANGASGGGQGPTRSSRPAGNALQVQVIGQQWAWTYRFPRTAGRDDALVLPVDRLVEFHVTSLDVVHSFWAYQLGVKADAVPGADNIAFVTATKPETFTIRCAELCGLWHGYMSHHGQVVAGSPSTPGSQRAAATALATRGLPPFSHVYFPDPPRARRMRLRRRPMTGAGHCAPARRARVRRRWRGVLGFNLLSAIVLALVGLRDRRVDRPSDRRAPRLRRGHRSERRRPAARLRPSPSSAGSPASAS